MMAAATSVPTQVAPDGSRLRDSSRSKGKRLQDLCDPDKSHAREANRPAAKPRFEVLDEPLPDGRSALAEGDHHGGHAGRKADAFGEPARRRYLETCRFRRDERLAKSGNFEQRPKIARLT